MNFKIRSIAKYFVIGLCGCFVANCYPCITLLGGSQEEVNSMHWIIDESLVSVFSLSAVDEDEDYVIVSTYQVIICNDMIALPCLP